MQARRQQRRVVAIVLAFVSAAGLAVGVFGDQWLVVPETNRVTGMADVCAFDRVNSLGLRTYERCRGACEARPTAELIDLIEARIKCAKDKNPTLPPPEQIKVPYSPWHGGPGLGLATFIAALLAAAGLLVGGVLALAGKRIAMPIMPTTLGVLGIAVSIVTGCIYVATKPDFSDAVIVGWSFIVFGIAAVIGLAAVFPLNRAIRPIDTELGEASATMSWGGSRDDHP